MVWVIIGYMFSLFQKIKNKCLASYNTYVLFGGIKYKHTGGGHISALVSITGKEKISVGKGTYINGGNLVAKRANITIGSNCLISYNVHLRTDMHCYKDANVLINKQGEVGKDIVIGNDCWIGYGAQIMSGVTIADGCVIGAGAVVTKDTEPFCVYGGVPAKKIGEREWKNR